MEKGIPINVYTIMEANNKCSLFPFSRWYCHEEIHQFSQILDYKLIFNRKHQENLEG